jgi:hypothetical protein
MFGCRANQSKEEKLLASGVEKVAIAVKKPSLVQPPGESPIGAEFASLFERAVEDPFVMIGKPIAKLSDCPAAQDEMRSLAATHSPDWIEFFDGLTDAVEQCACRVDLEGFKALRWWGSGRGPSGHYYTLVLTLRQGRRMPQAIVHSPELLRALRANSLPSAGALPFSGSLNCSLK